MSVRPARKIESLLQRSPAIEHVIPANCDLPPADLGVEPAPAGGVLGERAGVVAIPTSAFYDDAEAGRTLVRFAFCKRPEVLAEAVRRLVAASGASR